MLHQRLPEGLARPAPRLVSCVLRGPVSDSGCDMEGNFCWVVVSKPGTFAVGVPEAAQVLPEEDQTDETGQPEQPNDGSQDQKDNGLEEGGVGATPNQRQCGSRAVQLQSAGRSRFLFWWFRLATEPGW